MKKRKKSENKIKRAQYMAKYNAEYHKKNRTKRLEYHIKYKRKNRKKIAKYNIKYRRVNKKQLRVKRVEKRTENNINSAKYYRKNRKKILIRNAKYYQRNRKRILLNGAKYRKANRRCTNIKQAEYRKNNLKKLAFYKRNRRRKDPLYKLICNIRTAIWRAIKNKGFKKKTKTEAILGCKFEVFKRQIESQWEPWMNWGNYGKYNPNGHRTWQIDHVKPLCSSSSEKDIIKLNHHTNLRPLCSKDNNDKIQNDMLLSKKWHNY